MERFTLDEIQTDYILELKLYRLAKLEILAIREELAEKRAEAARIEALLADEGGRWGLIRGELAELRKSYGDARRTSLVGPQKETTFDPEAYIVREQAWVIVTRHGRVKRQKGFSGLEAIRVPDGDEVGWVLRTDTLQTVTFYSSAGSAYVMRVEAVAATTGYGEPVQSMFNFGDGERIVGVVGSDPKLQPAPAEIDVAGLTEEDPRPPFAVAISEQGKAVRFPLAAHAEVSTRAGRKYMSLADGDAVVSVYMCAGDENVAIASRGGHVLIFPVREIPPRAGAARGVNAIKLEDDDKVLGYALTTAKRDGLVCFTNRGREIIVRETSYSPASRGGKGTVVIRLGGLERCVVPVVVLQPPEEEGAPPTPEEDLPDGGEEP
jgi:DNA gyrase subunit A